MWGVRALTDPDYKHDRYHPGPRLALQYAVHDVEDGQDRESSTGKTTDTSCFVDNRGVAGEDLTNVVAKEVDRGRNHYTNEPGDDHCHDTDLLCFALHYRTCSGQPVCPV